MKWLQKFMYGRYGSDHLSLALLITSLVMSFLSAFTGLSVFTILSYIPIVLCFYRILSKNTTRRYEENVKFLNFCQPIQSVITAKCKHIKSLKNYKYYKCPNCKQALRVPRGRGKLIITCPKCKTDFRKRT